MEILARYWQLPVLWALASLTKRIRTLSYLTSTVSRHLMSTPLSNNVHAILLGHNVSGLPKIIDLQKVLRSAPALFREPSGKNSKLSS